MSIEKKQTFESVLSINPYNATYLKGTAGRISSIQDPSYEKEQYVLSFLNTKSFITTMVGVSKNIPEEDLQDAIENKVYEELALDLAVEYNIQFIPATEHVDESNFFYHVFVVDPLTLEEEFADAVDAVKYIDEIIPVPLLLKSLYQSEVVLDSGVHCYIYFQANDAFLTIYNEQEFVYTKSLKFSFKNMHEQFCELIGEQLSLADFTALLGSEGLSTSNTDYQKYLIKLFGEIFLHINDVLTYAKRAFSLDKIDTIYIGSQIGTIPGLDEYSQTYLGLISDPFDFNYGFDIPEGYIDQVHALMHLYAQLPESAKTTSNFSTFHRPPPFVKRNSGQLIILTAASFVIAFAYPVSFWLLAHFEKVHHAVLVQEYNELHNTRVTRERTIELKLEEKEKFAQLLNAEKEEFEEKKGTLIKIHDVKVNYPMKAKIMANFTEDFNKFDVKVTEIEYAQDEERGKEFTFTINAPKNKMISSLLKYLTETRKESYNFTLEQISYDATEKLYTSKLKAVIQ